MSRGKWLIRLAAAGSAALLAAGLMIARYGAHDRARPADVIIVLGGGESGTTRRAVHAAALYARRIAPVVLCSGGVRLGDGRSEAEWCAAVLAGRGVPAEAVALEQSSRSTEGNAREAAAIMGRAGWTSAVLVSDDFHLWRAWWTFRDQGVRVWTSPAQVTTGALPPAEKLFGVGREIAALGWLAGDRLVELASQGREG